MKTLWKRWVARLAHREPATPLALLRVTVGLVVVYTLGGMLWHGAGLDLLTDATHGGYRAFKKLPWLVDLLGGANPLTLNILQWGGLLGAALMTLGLGGRVTVFVLLQVCIGLFRINGEAGGGHDRMITNALWLLVLAPSTATLSLDCRLRTGSWRDDTPQLAFARYLVVYQLVLIYFTTGVQKLGPEWHPWGDWSALYYALQLPYYARWENLWVADVYPLTQLATATTWLWEVSAPALLLAFWFRATRERPGRLRALFNRLDVRSLYALVGVGVHLGIELTMNVGPFSWISLAMYVALWHHDEWLGLWGRVGQKLRG